MLHIVSFSTGLSSALTVERVLQRHGSKNVRIVFMDTLIEDDDNYRFGEECIERWEINFPGASVVRLEEGRTPYEVAEDNNMIFNQRRHPCTRILKIEPFVKYIRKIKGPKTIHIGFDYSELHRIPATKRNYEKLGHSVDFPLLWDPIEERSYSHVVGNDWNIDAPRMYAMGYSHANCGGVCVAMGMADWIRTLVNFPDRYAKAEKWEANMRKDPKLSNYAILRDQSAGKVRPRTLQELRTKYEAGDLPDRVIPSSCVVCGVGDPLQLSMDFN